MRNYLVSFFNDFKYEEEDAECLLNAYDTIVLNSEANRLLDECIELYKENINLNYYDDIIVNRAQKIAKIVNIHTYTVELLVFICLSKHLKSLYEKKGISQDVFYESMCDLRYKLDECKTVKGIIGSFVAWWFPGFFNMTRFGLGRLQFELTDFANDEYEKDGKKLKRGDRVIGVHIPRSLKPIDKESCDNAYKMAADFFKNDITNNPIAFVCHSWLLYSKTLEVFPQKTNTYRFAHEYDILWDTHDKEGEYNDAWRLFDMDYTGNIEDYPENTSMRRAYKDYLRNGGRTGEGYGVFFAK
ncbi:MAG: DUF5596 domain-containing protein [Clostridia bacterium]|nr:DUF5596 domain-containing protein [Clostridia bacterium]